MLVGIMGKMGTGKTLSMSVLASYLSRATGAPLWANYSLKGAKPLTSLDQINDTTCGIECIDEAWLSMDSRMWEDNVRISHWVNQTRKKKVIVFYTTQHIRQMEMRMRNATDILIVCEKKGRAIWLTFIDYQYKQIGKKFCINKPERFYGHLDEESKVLTGLYDTYEVLKPLKWTNTRERKPEYNGGEYAYQRRKSVRS